MTAADRVEEVSGSVSGYEVTQEHPAYLRQGLRQQKLGDAVFSQANGVFVAGDGDRGSGGGFGQWQRQRDRIRF